MIRIYHNPRCRKSREVLETLKKRTEELEIVEYLKNPPTPEELKWLTERMKIEPEDLVRKNEALYKEKFRGKTFTGPEWIKILSENPVLIERPIVVKGKTVILARPPEKIGLLP